MATTSSGGTGPAHPIDRDWVFGHALARVKAGHCARMNALSSDDLDNGVHRVRLLLRSETGPHCDDYLISVTRDQAAALYAAVESAPVVFPDGQGSEARAEPVAFDADDLAAMGPDSVYAAYRDRVNRWDTARRHHDAPARLAPAVRPRTRPRGAGRPAGRRPAASSTTSGADPGDAAEPGPDWAMRAAARLTVDLSAGRVATWRGARLSDFGPICGALARQRIGYNLAVEDQNDGVVLTLDPTGPAVWLPGHGDVEISAVEPDPAFADDAEVAW